MTSKRASNGGAEYRTWLKKECVEGRGKLIDRNPDELRRLTNFRKTLKQVDERLHAEDEWTVLCKLCSKRFHVHEVLRKKYAVEHVNAPTHKRLLAKGKFSNTLK